MVAVPVEFSGLRWMTELSFVSNIDTNYSKYIATSEIAQIKVLAICQSWKAKFTHLKCWWTVSFGMMQ